MADEKPIDWRVQNGIITKQLGYILKTGLHVDCEFVVGYEDTIKTFKGHKLILVTASPVFEAMFLGDLAERKSVVIPDIEPEAFEKMLEFIYTGKTTFNSIDEAFLIYYTANKYFLEELKKHCLTYCLKILNVLNACRCHKLAITYNISLLQDACLDWIYENFSEVVNNNCFKDADYSLVKYYLKRSSLSTQSELQVFKMVKQYVEGISEEVSNTSSSELENIEEHVERSPEVDVLVKKVRFLSMPAKDFANETYNSNLLTEYEKYAILMNMLLDNPPAMPEGFNKELSPRFLLKKKSLLQRYLNKL